jgi:alkaline phosphatase D
MNRRLFLCRLLQLPLVALALPSWARAAGAAAAFRTAVDQPPSINERSNDFRLAFGSCCMQDQEQTIWPAIEKTRPDIFAFIGDNIYADTENVEEIRAKYQQLAAQPPYAHFRRKVPMIATWDDHDFGINDGGAEYPKKPESKKLMLDFFGEPKDSARRKRDGVYTSYFYGKAPRKVQVILLDLRWFRSALYTEGDSYAPNPDPAATLLGPEQWAWLEEQLALPADARIIASSTQFSSPIHRWEKWANFPFEKARFLSLLDESAVKNVVIVSGDMHFAELSMEKTARGLEIYDLTSSGLTYSEPATDIENPNRLALADQDCNFGLVTIDWGARKIVLEARGLLGQHLFSHSLPLI